MKWILIDQELAFPFSGPGRFRSYQLIAEGNTYVELLDDATITEVDQDGGEIRTYKFEDAENGLQDAALTVILEKWRRANTFNIALHRRSLLRAGKIDGKKVLA